MNNQKCFPYFIMAMIISLMLSASCSQTGGPRELHRSLSAYSEEAGYTDTPALEFKTTPYLIYYDGSRNRIVVPEYFELEKQQKDFVDTYLSGSAVFKELFNWFFIAHEFGHFIQRETGQIEQSPYQLEFGANKFAVEFLSQYDPDRLINLQRQLLSVRENPIFGQFHINIPDFNSRYLEMAIDSPKEYLLYQIDMILFHMKQQL